MNKQIFFLIFLTGATSLYGQNLFGIRRVTTRAGTVTNVPHRDSKHYRIQLPNFNYDVDVRLFFHEYVNGNKKLDNFDNSMHITISKGNVFTMDFVPELESNGIFKLYMYYPGVTRYCYMFREHDKILKFIPYKKTDNIFDLPINVLLVYEDDKDGTMEKLVNSYSENGILKTDSKSDFKLRSQLKRYSIYYYIIDDRKK